MSVKLGGQATMPVNWLLKLLIIWFSIDTVVIAAGYYAVNVIEPHFPDWWREVICEYGSVVKPESDIVALPDPLLPKI